MLRCSPIVSRAMLLYRPSDPRRKNRKMMHHLATCVALFIVNLHWKSLGHPQGVEVGLLRPDEPQWCIYATCRDLTVRDPTPHTSYHLAEVDESIPPRRNADILPETQLYEVTATQSVRSIVFVCAPISAYLRFNLVGSGACITRGSTH